MRLPMEYLYTIVFTFALVIISMAIFWRSYFSAFRNYFNFKGRSSRKDFWGFIITHSLIMIWISSLISAFYDHSHMDEISEFCSVFIVIYYFATIIPLLSIEIRRYHDVGKRWYWIFVPIANFVLFFFASKENQMWTQNDNQPLNSTNQNIIYCEKCGTSNSITAKFCNGCGQPLNSNIGCRCPNCNIEYQDKNMMYCPSCGTKL